MSGMPAGERAVAAVHSGGPLGDNFTTCDGVTYNRTTLTWNFTFDYNGATRLAAHGDFIAKAVSDFDDDGVPNDFDNCPTAHNPGQENCNADAEDAWGYEQRGDACDPIPCAHGWPQPATMQVVSTSGNSFLKMVFGRAIDDEVEMEPRPSNRFYNGSNNGDLTGEITPAGVPTKFRFCQIDASKLIDCGPSFIRKEFAFAADGLTSTTRPYLRASMEDVASPGPTFHEEPFDYGLSPAALRRWDYVGDSAAWESAQPPWIDPVSVGSGDSYGAGTNLDGRFWEHADTDVGRYAVAVGATGYPIKTDGAAGSEDQHLSSHYQWQAPDRGLIRAKVGALKVRYFDWKLCDPLIPLYDGGPFESSTVMMSEAGYFGLVLRTGEGLLLDDYLDKGLTTLMRQGSVVWVSAAEASLDQAHAGPDASPHALAFAPDGSDVVDGVFFRGEVAGNAVDVGAPSLTRKGGPLRLSSFVGVYSRADDLAFVVGGGQVWFRAVEGSWPWTRSRLFSGYVPGQVLAATWSYRDQKLWILDSSGGMVRLTRVHPHSGYWDRLGEWKPSGSYDKQWLRVALDGNILLMSSSSSLDRHAVALFDSQGLHPFAPVKLAWLHVDSGALAVEPTVDRRGMSLFVALPKGGLEVRRHEGLIGSPAKLADLAGVL